MQRRQPRGRIQQPQPAGLRTPRPQPIRERQAGQPGVHPLLPSGQTTLRQRGRQPVLAAHLPDLRRGLPLGGPLLRRQLRQPRRIRKQRGPFPDQRQLSTQLLEFPRGLRAHRRRAFGEPGSPAVLCLRAAAQSPVESLRVESALSQVPGSCAGGGGAPVLVVHHRASPDEGLGSVRSARRRGERQRAAAAGPVNPLGAIHVQPPHRSQPVDDSREIRSGR